jgi:hypothetical protein
MFGKKKFETTQEQQAYQNARMQERVKRAGISGRQSAVPITERLAGLAKGVGGSQKKGGGMMNMLTDVGGTQKGKSSMFDMGIGSAKGKNSMFAFPTRKKGKKSPFGF